MSKFKYKNILLTGAAGALGEFPFDEAVRPVVNNFLRKKKAS